MNTIVRNPMFVAIVAIMLCATGLLLFRSQNIKDKKNLKEKDGPGEPAEWFYAQRSYPDAIFDYKAYQNAFKQARIQNSEKSGLPGTNTTWVLEGPENINGRVNCISVHPQNNNIIFAGTASGGVFKSTDGGNTWAGLFDDFSYLAVGDIEIDPQNPNIMFVGTGDPNISGYPFIGDGIYKTTDGGNNWTNCGLANTYIISKICINPRCPDTIYAATMGLPFARDNNRGLYKSIDGGQTWTQILFISNQAGIIDLVMDPAHPDTLYAAGWDRIRNNHESLVSGPAAKIYKTTNGGQTWTTLTTGLPSTDMSRIGLCMSETNSQLLYASYISPTLELNGIYKTINGGTTWTTVNTSGLPSDVMAGFGWYFGQIRVNPANNNDIFVLSVDLWRTTDGGANWNLAAPDWSQYIVHADKHDMVLLNSTTFLLGTDGGMYKTIDNAANWTDADFMPSTQIYRVNCNPHEPGVYYGGAQDNGTFGGNASQINSWGWYMGGDGFQPMFDPYDPNLRYYETQNGSLYYDDGMGGNDFTTGIDPTDRRSWDMPIVMSSFDNMKMFTGTYRVYSIPDAPYGSWASISGDLTDGINDRFHVITTVAESPLNANYLYAGTSDANVWRSLNGGSTWSNVTGILPDRYVTHVIASPNNAGTVFVAHSGYKDNDYIPHIQKSVNNGTSWTDISGNLPQLAINNIEVPAGYDDDIIFAATDGSVYATIDGGLNWNRLGNNMPLLAVYDIMYDTITHNLVAGTYGRAIQTYNLDSLFNYYTSITGLASEISNEAQIKFYPNPASDKVYFESSQDVSKVRLADINGKSFNPTFQISSGKCRIDISALPQGIYFIELYDNRSALLGSGKVLKL
jgi:photosystem II stability/assembly factor-like uncharacterized protein